MDACRRSCRNPPPRRRPPTGESVSSALDPFYNQVLTWTDCGNSLQCTTAKAPLDWSAPGTDTVDLALVRHVATGTRVGSLLVNPGGPGGSGYDFVKASLDYATDAKLQAGFDIVGFDPRGVGRSSAVKCYGAADMDQYLYAIPAAARGTDAWIQEVEKSSTEFGAACATNTGALLAHVDTVSAAHDLDMLRAVLGDKQAQLPRVLLRHLPRGDLRQPVPGQGRPPGSRRSPRPVDEQR
ncbi:alpha/beta fold hydrolase [Cryobacterium breve]|uniref:alpha/beta fold hydrolase n=1 Tax=Cryobacterium breve TaxID=1259258 RepID=UPI00248D32F6|nr:alpha/beta fold hydrolase [Cryobacterium breve]